MNGADARCIECAGPADHPRAPCAICGRTYAHALGVQKHGILHHGLNRREAGLLADRARFFIRGWPVPPVPPELANLIDPNATGAQPPVVEVDA
ncbi:MAG: hypothetical protein WAN74_07815 [Thermoplasmata archaeon]